jgi:hypothetical protein
MNWELYVLRGQSNRQARFEVFRAGIALPLFALGCLYSLTAAAAARAIDALVGLTLYYPEIRRLAKLRHQDLLSIYGNGILLTVAATSPVAALMSAHNWSHTAPLLALTIATLVGILLWFSMLFLLGHPLKAEISLLLNMLAERLGSRSNDSETR